MYKRLLFNRDRLRVHRQLFEELTLPSIAAQATGEFAGNVALHVVASDELPDEEKERLVSALSPFSWASAVFINADETIPFRELRDAFLAERVSSTACYAHCRIDDDDAISLDFVKQLRGYTRPELAGFVVSFAKGYNIYYSPDSGTVNGVYTIYSPKIAIGLSQIGMYSRDQKLGHQEAEIYDLGNHNKIDRHRPVLLDSRKPAFIRTIYPEQDTGAKKAPQGDPAEAYAVRKSFLLNTLEIPTAEESRTFKSLYKTDRLNAAPREGQLEQAGSARVPVTND